MSIRTPFLPLAAAVLCAAASAILWVLYFVLYWPYRALFDAAGRYVDESTWVVHHQQSGMLAIPAAVLLLCAVMLACVAWKRRRAGPGRS